MTPDNPANPPQRERRSPAEAENYFNFMFDARPAYLQPRQILFSDDSADMFVATVGSGIVFTIHDQELKMGAAGYMLLSQEMLECFPYFDKASSHEREAALLPIEDSIREMKRRGAGKHRLQIRLIGGGKIQEGDQDSGIKNYVFVREYLSRKGLTVMHEDVSGPYIRRVHFFATEGRAVRFVLRRGGDFSDMKAIEEKLNNKK